MLILIFEEVVGSETVIVPKAVLDEIRSNLNSVRSNLANSNSADSGDVLNVPPSSSFQVMNIPLSTSAESVFRDVIENNKPNYYYAYYDSNNNQNSIEHLYYSDTKEGNTLTNGVHIKFNRYTNYGGYTIQNFSRFDMSFGSEIVYTNCAENYPGLGNYTREDTTSIVAIGLLAVCVFLGFVNVLKGVLR